MTAAVGWFSDRFGRRTLFLAAIVGYAIALLGCGTAASLAEAVVWRFAQGVCGAVLLPLGQVIAVSAFPADRHGQATSLWALGFVTANVVAPSISGVIVEHLGWPWIFYAPIPLAVGVFLASFALVPHTERNPRPLDWTGFSALIIGVSVLQLMLARGGREDWFESTEILIEAMIAGIALYVFVVHTLTSRETFIDQTLFLDRNFSLGQVFIFLIGSVLFLPLLLLPLLLQHIGGYTAIDTGYLLLSRGVGSVIGLTIMSRFRDTYDPRPFLFLGLVLTAISAFAMARWTVDIRAWDVVWTSFVHGVASSAVWAPLNTLVLSRLPRRLQDQGFAFFYLCFDIGSAIGTAAVVGLHARLSQINRAVLTEHVTPFSETVRANTYPELWSLSEPSGLATIEEEVSRQATMIAYNNSFLVIGLVLASLIPFILLFRYRRGGPIET
jgi:DHA2 family multidrug resistance protein